MSNRRVAIIGIAVFLFLAFLATIYVPHFEQQMRKYVTIIPTPTQSATPLTTISDQSGLFHLVATYQGNSVWEYTVTAQLPTPCDGANVEVLIAESYPEQVSVNVTSTKSGDICVQMIQNYSNSGTFNASELATVRLSVKD